MPLGSRDDTTHKRTNTSMLIKHGIFAELHLMQINRKYGVSCQNWKELAMLDKDGINE